MFGSSGLEFTSDAAHHDCRKPKFGAPNVARGCQIVGVKDARRQRFSRCEMVGRYCSFRLR